MTVENRTNQQFFGEVLGGLSSRGQVTEATVNEFRQGLEKGDIKVIVSPAIGVWRVGGNLNGGRTAFVFLPEGTTRERIEGQAIDIMIEALTITRGLSGPEFRQMDDLESALRREIYGNG